MYICRFEAEHFTSQQARQNNLIFIRTSPIRIRFGIKFFRFIGFAKQINLYFTTLIFFKDSNNDSSPSRNMTKQEKANYKQNMKKCLTKNVTFLSFVYLTKAGGLKLRISERICGKITTMWVSGVQRKLTLFMKTRRQKPRKPLNWY
jgi:hypothetical protein